MFAEDVILYGNVPSMRNLVTTISTPRLLIRMLEIHDAADVQQLLAKNKERMLPWIPWAIDEPETVEVKKNKIRSWRGEFYLDQKYTYGVFEKAKEFLVGMIFLFTRQGKGTLEIGYVVDNNEAGKGYATESSYAVTRLGLEYLGIGKMVIHCNPENLASQRVPEKLGYKLEGSYGSAQKGVDGKRQLTMIWALFQEEFQLNPKFEPLDFGIDPGWD